MTSRNVGKVASAFNRYGTSLLNDTSKNQRLLFHRNGKSRITFRFSPCLVSRHARLIRRAIRRVPPFNPFESISLLASSPANTSQKNARELIPRVSLRGTTRNVRFPRTEPQRTDARCVIACATITIVGIITSVGIRTLCEFKGQGDVGREIRCYAMKKFAGARLRRRNKANCRSVPRARKRF